MTNKKSKLLFNFGEDDSHVQQWKNFLLEDVSYDLSHLDAHIVIYEDQESRESYQFIVTYSHHCFCKTEDDTVENSALIYPYNKDPREFHITRYELSRKLPAIIEKLPTLHTVHAGYGRYAIVEADIQGKKVYYFIVFVVFRSNKKYRLHVQSAYPLDHWPKMKKVGFFAIVKALKTGKPLPQPHK